MGAQRISDHAVVGDGRSVALISRDGDVRWLCWPRVDSPSLFGDLLDPEGGGFGVRLEAPDARSSQRYLPETSVLATEWRSSGARLRVLDFMPAATEEEKGREGWPEHALVRLVHCEQGPAQVVVRFDPRPDYGRGRARLTHHRTLGLRAHTPEGLLTLRTDPPAERAADGTLRFALSGGQSAALLLTFSVEAPAVLPPPRPFARHALWSTVRWWRRWAARARYDGPFREQVVRSALAVKLLNFAPSGAIVAAPTTSLPERLGGDLNWDYRFCWVRDAALTVRALRSLGYEEEAEAFVSWMLHATRLTRPRLRVLYDVYGRTPRKEEVLEHWRGFGGSRPVRIRNAAVEQLQLDTYGEVIDAVAQMARAGWRVDGETWEMLTDFGEFVCRSWESPDSGIWEPRGPPRHYTHSKLLCWVALERLLELHERFGYRARSADYFRRNRAALGELLRTRGWSEARQSYAQELGADTLDASVLLMSWYGFEDARTPRLRSTARAIAAGLSPRPGLLYRYEQSLAEREGAFLICSFWLAELLARGAGTLREAEEVFGAAAAFASPTGLLAEEVEVETGELLGNYPQAFSHIGLIGAALALEERRSEQRTRHAPYVRERQPEVSP